MTDRRWFAKNKRRTRRLRPVTPQEARETDAALMLVRQIEPGRRERIPVDIVGDVAAVVDDDDALAAIFELKRQRKPCWFYPGPDGRTMVAEWEGCR